MDAGLLGYRATADSHVYFSVSRPSFIFTRSQHGGLPREKAQNNMSQNALFRLAHEE